MPSFLEWCAAARMSLAQWYELAQEVPGFELGAAYLYVIYSLLLSGVGCP